MRRSFTHARVQELETRARQLRSRLTPSEATLWEALRRGALGVCFKRQVRIGRYICDFVAPSAKLVVEVDGGYHRTRRAADARRDRALVRMGYRVVRVEAELVLRELPRALQRVREALTHT
jgi:very-short-patch-repair endonuclease